MYLFAVHRQILVIHCFRFRLSDHLYFLYHAKKQKNFTLREIFNEKKATY